MSAICPLLAVVHFEYSTLLSLTPRFSEVNREGGQMANRFNGFSLSRLKRLTSLVARHHLAEARC